MTLKAIVTNKEHVDIFDPQEVGFNVPDALYFSLDYPSIRPMMSFFNDVGDIVFICGLSYISEGVWEAWLIPSKRLHNYAKASVRALSDFTNWVLEHFNAHRVQIAVLDENKKWAEALGFQFESIVKKYHSGKDHSMYVKVRD